MVDDIEKYLYDSHLPTYSWCNKLLISVPPYSNFQITWECQTILVVCVTSKLTNLNPILNRCSGFHCYPTRTPGLKAESLPLWHISTNNEHVRLRKEHISCLYDIRVALEVTLQTSSPTCRAHKADWVRKRVWWILPANLLIPAGPVLSIPFDDLFYIFLHYIPPHISFLHLQWACNYSAGRTASVQYRLTSVVNIWSIHFVIQKSHRASFEFPPLLYTVFAHVLSAVAAFPTEDEESLTTNPKVQK